MRRFRRWLRRHEVRYVLAGVIATGLGWAFFDFAPPSLAARQYWAMAVVVLGFWLVVYGLRFLVRFREPFPFGESEIGILIDSDDPAFAHAIARHGEETELRGRFAFQTLEEPIALPMQPDVRDKLRNGLRARLLLHDTGRGPVHLIVLDGPPAASRTTPAVFYAEIYHWQLSDRDPGNVARFVVAYALYRRELYVQLNRWVDNLAGAEAAFLEGCAFLRIDETPRLLPPSSYERVGALFIKAGEIWDRWLFPDCWAAAKNNLGIAYLTLDVAKSIDAFSAALEVRSREKDPRAWAYTTNNLAIADVRTGRQQEALGLLANARDALSAASHTADSKLVARNLDRFSPRTRPGAPQPAPVSAEVDAARTQMRQLIGIPEGAFVRPGIHIAHRLMQATTISGDFYKIVPRHDGSVGITLVDVEGHGLAASATAIAVEKALFRPGANWGRGDAREQLVLADAVLSEELGRDGAAVTMNFLEVDPVRKVVRYAGAGMPFPLLFRFGEAQPEPLTAVGMYVGDGYRRVRVTPNRAEAPVGDGDLVLLFTDGISEARDQRGRIFGQNGIIAAVVGADRRSPEAVVDAVLAAAYRHSGRQQPEDDQAILAIQIGTPPKAAEEGAPLLVRVEPALETAAGVVAYELTNARDSGQYMKDLGRDLMAWAERLLPQEQRQKAWSALVEAIQNALRYGCDPGEVIGIEFQPTAAGIEIIVSQPKRWEDWDLSLGARRPSQELASTGVGTLTMLRLANEVSVSDQGRRVHLRFDRDFAAAGGRAPDSAPAPVLRLLSPHDIELEFEFDAWRLGISVAAVNRRTANLLEFRVVLLDARSFDSLKQRFREGFGLRGRPVMQEKIVLAGDRTASNWVVRVQGDHLVVGNEAGESSLLWPKGDPASSEIWRLDVSIDAAGIEPWIFALRLEWVRGAGELTLRQE